MIPEDAWRALENLFNEEPSDFLYRGTNTVALTRRGFYNGHGYSGLETSVDGSKALSSPLYN
jgi:hypothetical protein